MRRFSKNETMSHDMERRILNNHPGIRIQKKRYGTVEKVLLALIAACFLIVVVSLILR